VVSILAFHAGYPGSSPGIGTSTFFGSSHTPHVLVSTLLPHILFITSRDLPLGYYYEYAPLEPSLDSFVEDERANLLISSRQSFLKILPIDICERLAPKSLPKRILIPSTHRSNNNVQLVRMLQVSLREAGINRAKLVDEEGP
jgi:hypothetical protein